MLMILFQTVLPVRGLNGLWSTPGFRDLIWVLQAVKANEAFISE